MAWPGALAPLKRHLPDRVGATFEAIVQHPAEHSQQLLALVRREGVPEGRRRGPVGSQARGDTWAGVRRGMTTILRASGVGPGTSGRVPTRPRGRRPQRPLYSPRQRVSRVQGLDGTFLSVRRK